MKKGLWVVCIAGLVGTGWTLAQTASPQQPEKTTPAFEQTGEPEGDTVHLPAIPVDPRVYALGDPHLSALARKIENGSANLIERRAWWWLEQRLAPYDKLPPPDWHIRAQARVTALEATARQEGTTPEATTYAWAPIGGFTYPDYFNDNVSGRATAIWVDPTNANSILLGTADGGVWKTTDKGTTWTSIFDTSASLSIGSIGVDPNNSQVVYVGTGEANNNGDMIGGAGMYKSTNGGSTWSLLTLPSFYYSPPFNGIRRIAVDPRNSNNVYAVGDNGLFYSTNAGANWSQTNCGSGGYIASDLALDAATNPTTVLVAFGSSWSSAANGVYRATAGAGPWTTIGSASYGNGFPSTNISRITLLLAPSDPKQAYALIQNTSTSQSLGIFYTADITATPVTWVAKSTTNFCSTQCWYDMTGAVNPTDPTRLIVGGLDNYISTNTGGTITKVSNWAGSGTGFSHADHHHMVMTDATTVYDANDGGFFIGTINWTTPASTTWVNKNSGLNTLQFYGFAQHPWDATKIQGGLQDNGQFYYNGSSWLEVEGGDGGCSAWDQSDEHYAYEEYVYLNIARNSNMVGSPSNWTCIMNFGGCSTCNGCVPDTRVAFIAPFTLDANNQNTLYGGTYRVLSNTAPRTGSSWAAISTDLTGGSGNICAVHSARNNGTSGTIYVGTTSGKAQVTTNGGTNWTDVSSGLSGAAVTSFATDPTNGLRVLVTVSGYGAAHIYRSTTGSTAGTWTNITGALPAVPFNTIILDPADSNHAYAGSDFGVFENTAVWSGTTWTSIKGNLPAVSIQQLGMMPGGRLRAATHGRAIWERVVNSGYNPKEDSPALDMKASRATGTQISLSFTNGCGATDNTVYTGNLDTLKTGGIAWTGRHCSKGTASPVVFDPGAGNFYFVIVGNNNGIEGSYGQNSSSVERPAAGAGSPCSYTQNLTGTCP